jgi:uncharacterized protein DUF3419
MNAPWIADALRMPLAFAQVREDSRLDIAVLDRLGRSDASGVMIASGGCTAAALAASGRIAALHLVDANPAQLALTRLKLHLIRHAAPTYRCEVLGHAPMGSRAKELASLFDALGLHPNVLGSLDRVAELGPDHAGRYELVFACLRAAMGAQAKAWPAVLANRCAADAAAPDTALGRSLDEAFDQVMALDNLIALFGQAATQNRVEPFARHFAGRTRHALASLPTADNPFLWQLLVGRFPPDGMYDWLTLPSPLRMPELTWSHDPMHVVLAGIEERFDFIHLSNILDWLSPAEAAQLLQLTHRALKPGGLTLIRQLNSSLNLPALNPAFDWLTAESNVLHARDRSFFYRHLHLGRRR